MTTVPWLLPLSIPPLGFGCGNSRAEAVLPADAVRDGGTPTQVDGGSEGPSIDLEGLGEQLFFDVSLSRNRTQACATCHDPAAAFVDARMRTDGLSRAASLGDDGTSLGDRNAPTLTYALLAPAFGEGSRERHNTDGDIAEYRGYLGGLFHDGRASSLEEQATAPPLNPIEMGMPDERSIVDRLLGNPNYVTAFEHLHGGRVWKDEHTAYLAMAKSIAAFERTREFAAFDSRYDRSLLPPGNDSRYTYHPASPAALGKALFFSTEFTSCAACHQLHPLGSTASREELFTGFEYHNLGVPENRALRELNGAAADLGLGGRLEERAENGKFKTPTLRNVAVSAPYMHNGVFSELSTVIRFYEHAKLRARGEENPTINLETGEPFGEPEVDENLSRPELAGGNKDLADDQNVQALVCFLASLTDARYEPLLDPSEVERCGL